MRRNKPLVALIAFLAISSVASAQPAADDDVEVEGEDVEVEDEEVEDEEVEDEELEDEEVEDEEEEDEEEEVDDLIVEDPSRPAPAGKGVVWGTLTDANGEPLIEAEVSVVGTDIQVFTDFDGNYRLELPPGTYDLRFWYELHDPIQLQGVDVAQGELVRVNEKLKAQKQGAVEVIVVEAETESSSTEGQILERKRAAAVGDRIGRGEMSKQGDKSAADAARRVVGITVEGSRFVFIRGLGERYTNALLDGAPLPSPEPDRQAIPFDLFPSLMLDGVNVAKTFTPDSPGDFAGGSVRISTRRVPEEFLFNVSLSASINSQSSFREGLTYRGSKTDWLGIDSGKRALPKSIPDYKIARGLPTATEQFISLDELKRHGDAINSRMSTERTTFPLDHGGSVVIGNSWDTGKDSRLGVMAALSYSRKFELIDDEIVRTFGVDTETRGLRLLNDLGVERGRDRVRWGGLAGVTYELDKHQRLHLTGLHSRSSDKDATELEGRHEERGALLHETRLRFVTRALTFGQLRGEHEIVDMNEAEIDWNLSLSRADRLEPNTRSTVYQFTSGFGYAYEDSSQSGMHFYSDQSEQTFGGGINYKQPLNDTTGTTPTFLKIGSQVSLRAREFDARRFRYRPIDGGNTDSLICNIDVWDQTCPDQVFDGANIGTSLELEENTRPNDAYTADLNVFAGYAMIDTVFAPDLRLIVGERMEASEQTINSFDPHSPDVGRIDSGYESLDFLPAAALVWSVLPTANLRASGTRTVARPQLREVAPFSFTDYFGGREVQGNPELNPTQIYNVDLRFEWFPTLREVLAASVFFKRFSDPIESVIQSAGARGIVTFQNADNANLFGVELEARKNFGFIATPLKDLSIVSNVTVAQSRVELNPDTAAFVTNPDRPLSRQAPYIINIALDYANEDSGTRARIGYNIVGKRITAVGTAGLPDAYGQPRHQLDAVVSQEVLDGLRLSASGKNLLNDDYRETQGAEDSDAALVRRFRRGISVGLGASYTY